MGEDYSIRTISESVRQVHDHRKIYSNFQRLLLSKVFWHLFCCPMWPTTFIWCKNKQQIFPDAKKLKVNSTEDFTVLVQIQLIIHAHTH